MNASHDLDDVPAHRVVNRNGLLTGKHFFSGSNLMRELLESEGIKIENLLDKKELEISCRGVFIAIGHAPSNELIINQLETHNGGYVVTKPNSTETSVPGVFAAGDITDFKYRQAVTAAGTGCMAALDAERYLASIGF